MNRIPLIFKLIRCEYYESPFCSYGITKDCLNMFKLGFEIIKSDQFDSECIVCSY